MFKDDRDFRKDLYDMSKMVKVLYNERTTRLQGESPNQPKGNSGDGSKPPPPLPPSPPSTPPSSPPSPHNPTPPPSPKGYAKYPLVKIDVKFEFPMYTEEVNAKTLDNWVCQVEVYCRIQNIDDDVTKI